MQLGVVFGFIVLSGGFAAAQGFRWKRQRQAVDYRIAQKDLRSRRHHFRGAEDVELVRNPRDEDLNGPTRVN